jgi:hypothetical protein
MTEAFTDPVAVIEAALAGERPAVEDGYSANALVLGASGQPGEEHVCGELLSVFEPVNVLGVAVQNDPDYYRRVTDEHFETTPARLGVLDVGAQETHEDGVRAISSASDLTGIGIGVTDTIKGWADADERTVVCFDALTPLLQYSEMERVYRFLDVTTRRLGQVCAVSHVHVNPLAHDERTVQRLMSVFDAVVEADDDGEWSVRRA